MMSDNKIPEELEKRVGEEQEASDLLSADPMARYKDKKPKAGSGKKSRIAAVIIGVVVVAALAGAVAAINITGIGKKEETESETAAGEQADFTLLSGESSDKIKTVKVSYPEGSYTVYRAKDAAGDDKEEFSIEGYEDYTLDTSVLSTLANNACGLTGNQKVAENSDDLSKFGLGETAVHVLVEADDGQTADFRVGDKTADQSYFYFCMEGENTVYTVDAASLNNYTYTEEDFISKKVVDVIDEDDDSSPHVSSMILERRDVDYIIDLEYDKETAKKNSEETEDSSAEEKKIDLKMVEPVDFAINSTRADDVVNGLFGKTVKDIACIAPTKADFTEYGFDDMEAAVKFALSDGSEYTLEIGGTLKSSEDVQADDMHYIYIEGGDDIIYTLDDASLPWLTVTPIDISSKIIFDCYVWDVGSLQVATAEGEELDFAGKGSDKDNYVVTNKGKACDTERFRAFYAFLIKAYAEEIVLDEENTGDLMLSVKYSEQGGKEHTVNFYDAGNLKCFIEVDGQAAFKCRKSFVEAVIHNTEIFDTDEEFQTSWS